MEKIIHCQKLKKNLPALPEAPLPGDFGQKVLNHISAQAWDMWIEEQTKLINENKLQLFKKEARELLLTKAEEFLFSEAE
ncbi:MAG TPA: oxidative damage protection protein [Oligoflexia bacterium]|mgnify:CR=1 FL=1|nr:oxidative damage protection protein [Oligoflexia bacterium]HMR25724.1 oxidative damage protection protein [Oligoflexia bacterium]